MATFSLSVSSSLLQVDPKTLRRWLRLAQCAPRLDPLDARRRCLTLQQLQQLARLHGRPLPHAPSLSPAPPPTPTSPVVPTSSSEADLRASLASLQDRVSLLQEQVVQLTAALIRERDLRLQQLTGITQPLRPVPDTPADPPLPVSSPQPPPAGSSAPLKPLPRHPHPSILPVIEAREDGSIVLIDPQRGLLPLVPDTPAWFEWLASLPSFRFQSPQGRFATQRKTIGGLPTREWRAYHNAHNRTYSFYLGMTETLTVARLQQMAAIITARVSSS